MTQLDWLILFPLIPATPYLVLGWLPNIEEYIFKKVPKPILGPYLLYAAFAWWHFHEPADRFAWIPEIVLLVSGTIVSIIAVYEHSKKNNSHPRSIAPLLEELDVVRTKRAVSEKIAAGATGTIVRVNSATAPASFIVEFMDGQNSIGVVDVEGTDLELVIKAPSSKSRT